MLQNRRAGLVGGENVRCSSCEDFQDLAASQQTGETLKWAGQAEGRGWWRGGLTEEEIRLREIMALKVR